MKTEVEVKFLDVDFDEVRAKLEQLGAVCEQPMRLMKRAIIDYPDRRMQTKRDAHIRVRDEGDKITLVFKQHTGFAVDEAQELETIVDSFDETVKIFEEVGLKVVSLQESKRETWRLRDIEIVLDEWPWLKPYLEIEGESEVELREVAQKLGFDWGNAAFGDIMTVYRAQYPHLNEKDTVGTLAEVRFDAQLPDMLKDN